MNYDLQKLSVRLRSKELFTIGSGLLYVNNHSNYSYVITAAHVVDNVDYPIQIECYSDEKTLNDEYVFSVCKVDVIFHSNYVPTDNSKDKDEFDTAIIRIPQKSWMKELKNVYFGNAQVNQKIEGFGYLSQSTEKIISLDVKSITSKESLITNTSNISNRMKALLRGNFDLDHSDRDCEMTGLSGMVLAVANQEEIIIVGLAINIPEPNGLMGQTTLINLNIAKELLEQEGIECIWKKIEEATNKSGVEVTKNIIQSTRFFVHREAELEKIKNDLCRNNSTVLYGMGGIGKTSLAKHYAFKHGNSYTQSYFIHCSESIASGIANHIKIRGIERQRVDDVLENDIQFSQRILDFIKTQRNNSWLMIFDDVSPRDSLLEQVSELVQHKIFTSRWNQNEWSVPVIEINELPDLDSQKDLFEQYLARNLSSNELNTFRDISKMILGHTLTLQLIALQCRESDLTLKEIYEVLETSGIHIDSSDTFIYGKSLSERNMYGHIRDIWNLSNFSKNENRIMQGLCLIAPNGITKIEYKQWLKLENMNDINRLIRQGWIQTSINNEHEIIHLHSVIGEVIYHELYVINPENIMTMIEELFKKVNNRSLEMNEQLRYIVYGTSVGKRLLISIEAVLLLNIVGLHLEYFRQLDEALEILNKALEYIKTLNIEDSILGGHTCNNLAVVYHTQLNYELALKWFYKAVEIYKKCGKYAKGNLGYALHNIAKIHNQKNEIDKVLSIEEEAESYIRYFRKESLGEIYDLRRECYNKLATKNLEVYRTQSISSSSNYLLLNVLRKKVIEYIDKTLQCGEMAIDYKLKYNNKDEYQINSSIFNHAINKAIYKKDQQAIKDIQGVLDFFIKTTGNKSEHTGNTYNAMCTIYRNLGDFNKACEYGKKAVEILTNSLEDNHPFVKEAKENLNIAKQALNNL